jgi:hypothetical protein
MDNHPPTMAISSHAAIVFSCFFFDRVKRNACYLHQFFKRRKERERTRVQSVTYHISKRDQKKKKTAPTNPLSTINKPTKEKQGWLT